MVAVVVAVVAAVVVAVAAQIRLRAMEIQTTRTIPFLILVPFRQTKVWDQTTVPLEVRA